ncbi:putative outer membrane starch-binding protein [Arcticibacter tournemirensis]|uniref:RagB/SusD family nutrient uptake outer membrane protein n=1 Tax=Arcticibacter tournemirensis TaxID=699437 RepID=A0A5M9HHA8_9SPHI|nr:RagB/SusD family nutrient uptake outer membrane protein [Arcticibacter tournemirensis]KAA8484718.1 RagB/SusD family nutrient uptake outer membrane protein [Arcticibacter tournemirensis]TQM46983.1 putative outer membrane starch-binding protein [Arcticibacter tournemirensis]
MKKYLMIIIVVLLGSTSCNKFLDTEPTNFISPDYKTIAQLETGLAGVYDDLGMVYQDVWPYWINATTDVEYDRTGSSNSTIYVYSPADVYITNFWKFLYQGIYRANSVLAGTDNPGLDETPRDRIKGQALFLRAYFYFLLVSNFGDVPLMLDANPSITNLNVPRTPMKEVYDKIVTDMIEAEGLVDEAGEGGATFGGRVSKSAVRGILARVYLKMAGHPLNDKSKYEESLKWALKVKDSGKHSLEPDYREIFKRYARDEYDLNESIWEVEYNGNGTGNNQEYTYYIGARCGILCVDLEKGKSGGLLMASKKLYNLYGEEALSSTSPKASQDIRRDWNIATYSWGNQPKAVYTPVTDLFRRYAGKWRREYETLTPKGNNISGQNFPVLRYSDVLLMIAEAENELRGPGGAYEYVNQVRRRGHGILYGNRLRAIVVTNQGSNYTSVPTVTISGGATATAMINGGKVVAITLDEPAKLTKTGPYYTVSPTVTISGGGGSGATAVAAITSADGADLTADQTSSKEALFQAIKDERARELCFETSRRPDLIRWGNFEAVIKQYAVEGKAMGMTDPMVAWTNNVSFRTELLPIPIYDMTLNKALVQNPGY